MLAAIPVRISSEDALYAVHAKNKEGVNHVDCHVEGEVQEEFNVALTNAISHPKTVMIHSEDAPSTFTAVMSPRRLHTMAQMACLSKLLLYVD